MYPVVMESSSCCYHDLHMWWWATEQGSFGGHSYISNGVRMLPPEYLIDRSLPGHRRPIFVYTVIVLVEHLRSFRSDINVPCRPITDVRQRHLRLCTPRVVQYGTTRNWVLMVV